MSIQQHKSAYAETLLTEKHSAPRKACLTITRDVAHTPAEGIGLNITLDAQAENCYPETGDEAGWRSLLDRLAWLSPSWLCLTLPAEEVADRDGRMVDTADVLKRLDRFCGWAEQRKADINLMFPKSTPSWLRFKETSSQSPAPADVGAYANLVGEVADYLRHGKGYSRIKYLTIFGEPFNEDGGDFSFGTPRGIDPYAYYVDLYRSVRKALDSRNLSDLGLTGPNATDVFAYLETIKRFAARGLDLRPYIAAVDMHSYRMRFDYLPPAQQTPTCTLSEYTEDYLRPAVEYARAEGKPFFITELLRIA